MTNKNECSKKIYRSNFPEGTPTSVKSNRILQLIQDVWSKKPIPLDILNSDGSVARQIEAQFDPTYDPDIPTDAGKLAAGQRYGSRGNKTVALDLADNWYEIIVGSKYHSKDQKKAARQQPIYPPTRRILKLLLII